MKTKTTLFFLLLLRFSIANAQTEYLVTLDPSNFNFSKVDSLTRLKWINVPTSTFDNARHRYIFQGMEADMNTKLYTVDATAGSILYNPDFPVLPNTDDNIVYWQYSNSLHKLLGLHWNSLQSLEYFISIDFTTGAYTIIDTLPGVAWIYSTAAFDDINNRYIFIGGDSSNNSHLYSINAATGAIVSQPSFPALADPLDNIVEPEYGNATNKLYALHWDNSAGTEYFVSIDPATGAHTIINSIPGVAWIQGGFTTFDEFHKRYLFKGGDNSGNWYLYSIDAVTGNVTYNPTFPVFPGDDNIIMPETDSTNGVTYALHWETITGINDYANDHIRSFSPNPFSDNAKITTDKQYEEITAFVYNASGQMVKKETVYNSSELTLSRDGLPGGQFFISVICDQLYSGTVKATIMK